MGEEQKNDFLEVANIKNYEFSKLYYGLKGINGYADKTFKPENQIIISEFTKTLLASFGKVMPISPKLWYQNYVDKAKEMGVIETADNYSYENGMQRKDMAKMICKILGILPGISSTAIFADTQGIDTQWIDKAYSEYLIRGYYKGGVRTFAPKYLASRAEACTMIINALEYKLNPQLYKTTKEKLFREQEAKN